jgi:hypothetical protein
MPRLSDALAQLPVDSALVDAEAFVLDAVGTPGLDALQNAYDRRSAADITVRGRVAAREGVFSRLVDTLSDAASSVLLDR